MDRDDGSLHGGSEHLQRASCRKSQPGRFQPPAALVKISLLVLVLLTGAALRLHGVARDARFHPDEALYNTFARDAAIKGDWLFERPLDKPPLMLYANALAMTAVGVTVNPDGVLDFPGVRTGEFAGRLPNTFVSILLLAAVYALASRLYRDRTTALLAMLLVALSPFAIAFSPTAFTDVFMTFWMVMALWLAARDRWGAAGICLALGFASKQPAPLYLPLILGIGLVSISCLDPRWHGIARRLVRFAILFMLGIALLLVWDAARGQPTIWQVSAGRENYPNRLADVEDIVPRLGIWLGYARWLVGPGWITAGLSLLAVVAWTVRLAQSRFRRELVIDGMILIYVLGYGLLHWLAAFNTFDRYLLPLLPLLALLAARGITWLGKILTQRHRGTETQRKSTAAMAMLVCALVGALFIPAVDASTGWVRIGGDHGEQAGIDRLADYLTNKPVATVIYDRWLGWELEYYMGAWSDKRRVYYPTPDLLVRDALRLREIGPRYFPVPSDAPVQPWLDALDKAGFAPTPVYFSARFTVYRLTPPGVLTGASDAG